MSESCAEFKPNLQVEIAGLKLKNPIMPASGCFGYGREFAAYYPLSKLGAVVVKATTLKPRIGNSTPRIAEVTAGMLNAIGLANPGVEQVINQELPWLRQQNVPIIVNIAGQTEEEYCEVTRRICDTNLADAVELNVSCPNVDAGGISFGVNPHILQELVNRVKRWCSLPLFVKLSPNVTKIQEIAVAAEQGGADGLSLINTLIGMKIDLTTGKPLLANRIGGLSGPAIKPIAVRMVYEVAKSVNIPIIGMGGIYSGEDVIEFIMAGASAVMVGTANFTNPLACPQIIAETAGYLRQHDVYNLEQIKGCAL